MADRDRSRRGREVGGSSATCAEIPDGDLGDIFEEADDRVGNALAVFDAKTNFGAPANGSSAPYHWLKLQPELLSDRARENTTKGVLVGVKIIETNLPPLTPPPTCDLGYEPGGDQCVPCDCTNKKQKCDDDHPGDEGAACECKRELVSCKFLPCPGSMEPCPKMNPP
jgi:hypothetical protein